MVPHEALPIVRKSAHVYDRIIETWRFLAFTLRRLTL